MSAVLPGLVAGLAVAVAALLMAERRGSALGKWIAKPIASGIFLAMALVAGAADTTYGQWILVGLVLGAAGDILLIPGDKRAFLAGLGVFLLGHIAYTIAFAVPDQAGVFTALALLALALPAGVVARWLWPHVPARMRGPVAAYIVAITCMVAFAAGAVVAWQAPWQVPLGAAMFFASDLAVARDRFVAPGFVNRAWGLPLYYGGQALLAWSVTAT